MAAEDGGNPPNTDRPQRPDYNPNVGPRALKTKDQLAKILEKPTEKQLDKIADTIAAREGISHDEARIRAGEEVDFLRDRMQALSDLDSQVKIARKDTLSAKKGDYQEARQTLRDVRSQRQALESDINGVVRNLRQAGLMQEAGQGARWGLKEHLGKLGHGIDTTSYDAGYKLGWGVASTAAGGADLARSALEATAAGGRRVGEAGSQAASFLGEKASEGGSKAVEGGRAAIESGRTGLRNMLRFSGEAVRHGYRGGERAMGNILGGVRSRLEAGGAKIGEGVGALRESRAAQAVVSGWDATSEWTRQVGSAVGERAGAVKAAVTVDNFKDQMRKIGEASKGRVDQVTHAVMELASEQGRRVNELQERVRAKVGQEMRTAVDKGKFFLEPAWESIQRDREKLRGEYTILADKLGVVMEGVSDVARPVVDRILDEGRDARDKALGFSHHQLEGMRKFGKGVADRVTDSPAWNSMAERWENLRLRSNESRERVNAFLGGVLGSAGERFTTLKESAGAKKDRALEFGRNVKEKGAIAKEFASRSKEQMGQALDKMKRYWEIYAVDKWQEKKLPQIDIQRRLKVLRGAGAASLKAATEGAGRVGSMGTAAAFEGAVLASKLARDRRVQIALPIAAAGLFALTHHDAISQFFNNGVHLPEIGGGSHLSSGPDASPMGTPHLDHGSTSPIDTSTPGGDQSGFPSYDTAPHHPTPSIDSHPSPGHEAASSPVSPDIHPDHAIPDPSKGLIAPQAEAIAHGNQEVYMKSLMDSLKTYKDVYTNFAQEIIRNSTNATEVASARQQLDAINTITSNPGFDPNANDANFRLLMDAMHWIPGRS